MLRLNKLLASKETVEFLIQVITITSILAVKNISPVLKWISDKDAAYVQFTHFIEAIHQVVSHGADHKHQNADSNQPRIKKASLRTGSKQTTRSL